MLFFVRCRLQLSSCKQQNDHIDEAHMIHCATNQFIYYYYRERCGVFCASALDKS
jgi:hypothetical protein